MFAPILSRDAFVNINNSILTLTNNSPIDNVLLEYRLAIDLQKHNMIELICPIMIGDLNNDVYSNYFQSGCHPNLASMDSVVIQSIENRVADVLDAQSLGTSLISNNSVRDIFNSITKNQGLIQTIYSPDYNYNYYRLFR